MIRARVVLATLLSLGAAVARAQTPPPLTPGQSASLAVALRLWSFDLAADPSRFTVTPGAGHYDVTIPIQGQLGGGGPRVEGGPITAEASPGPDGRWRFQAITLPSPLRTTWTPTPGATPRRSTETLGGQTASADVDPTLASPSTGEAAYTDARFVTEGQGPASVLTLARASTRDSWVPASPGRVDVTSVRRAEDIAWGTVPPPRPGDSPTAAPPGASPTAPSPAGAPPPGGVRVRAASLTTQSLGLDPDRASQLARRAVLFLIGLPPGNAALSLDQRAELHHLLAMTRDLASESRLTLAADGIAVASPTWPVNLAHLGFTGSVAAPDGKLATRMRLEVGGIDLPSLPPGPVRDLLPRHVVLAPYVTGTPVEDIFAMIDQMIDDGADRDAVARDAMRRLAAAPVTIGIDALSLDLGPALLDAHGAVTVTAPGRMDGSALIEATGLDALIREASQNRLLKQGVPVLIFLKGIGDQTGDKVVWNLAYRDGAFTVNGTDMSGMLPGR